MGFQDKATGNNVHLKVFLSNTRKSLLPYYCQYLTSFCSQQQGYGGYPPQDFPQQSQYGGFQVKLHQELDLIMLTS
jgi:hypothetical protein